MRLIYVALFTLIWNAATSQNISPRGIRNPGIAPYLHYGSYNLHSEALLKSPHVRSLYIIYTWKDLQPEPGRYAFEEIIGRCLADAKKAGLGIGFQIWFGPSAPDWIYEHGVLKVQVKPVGDYSYPDREYPYYFAKEYLKYFYAFIDAFSNYIKKLPEEDVNRLLYYHVSEGFTGIQDPIREQINR
ncbi:hypothetical protein G5B30_01230 [Sphingobacterium sp. SGG-5]|uniref:hypothetical protein n=1 Tax=Sphingobacterium sp. SGG-5 TaxID=2710881 RepID=UPI0013ED65D7|nr:hypothetical protein [Sphingobacterium sp. SGG-5]NGM60526.1 hypothetical protein [Sphingobacterium sp. SGG-5]